MKTLISVNNSLLDTEWIRRGRYVVMLVSVLALGACQFTTNLYEDELIIKPAYNNYRIDNNVGKPGLVDYVEEDSQYCDGPCTTATVSLESDSAAFAGFLVQCTNAACSEFVSVTPQYYVESQGSAVSLFPIQIVNNSECVPIADLRLRARTTDGSNASVKAKLSRYCWVPD